MLAYKKLRTQLQRMPGGRIGFRFYSPMYHCHWKHRQAHVEIMKISNGIYACTRPDHPLLEEYTGVLVELEVWGAIEIGENDVLRAQHARIVNVLDDALGYALQSADVPKWVTLDHCTTPLSAAWFVIYDVWHDCKLPLHMIEQARKIAVSGTGVRSTAARAALSWAMHVDRSPRDDTRIMACMIPMYAYHYATSVDKGPHYETAFACAGDEKHLRNYATYVDTDVLKHPAIRARALKRYDTALRYAICVDGGPSDDTRAVASTHPEYAYIYARYVDKQPHPVTQAGADRDPDYSYRYSFFVAS